MEAEETIEIKKEKEEILSYVKKKKMIQCVRAYTVPRDIYMYSNNNNNIFFCILYSNPNYEEENGTLNNAGRSSMVGICI